MRQQKLSGTFNVNLAEHGNSSTHESVVKYKLFQLLTSQLVDLSIYCKVCVVRHVSAVTAL